MIDTKCLFGSLDHMSWTLAFSARAYSRSDHAQLFKVVIPNIALEEIGDMLSGTLWRNSLVSPYQNDWTSLYPTRDYRSGVIGVALDFAHSFQLNGHQSDILPALE